MTSPAKWFAFSFLAIFIVLGISYASSVQNIATRTSSEIDVLSDIEKVGVIRNELDENNIEYFDVEELFARFLIEVASVQKNLNYDIKVEFVYLDKNGNVTKNEKDIRGIQYRLQYLNDKGEVKGTAEGRQSLHELSF